MRSRVSSGVRRRIRVQEWAWIWALPAPRFWELGFVWHGSEVVGKRGQKIPGGEVQGGRAGWEKHLEAAGGDGHRDLEGAIFLVLLACREGLAKEERNSAGGSEE